MRTARVPRYISRCRVACLYLCIAAVAPCHASSEAGDSATDLIEWMNQSLAFPTNASMRVTVESTGTWHNAPSVDGTQHTAVVHDLWDAKSDAAHYGKEIRRTSPTGASRIRTVYSEGQRRVFEFDAGAAPDAAVLGRLYIRSQPAESDLWLAPIVDYFDRAFFMSGRYSANYFPPETAGAMVPIDGHPCHVVQGSWRGREFTLWLDPAYGCLPRQYRMYFDSPQVRSRRSGGGLGTAEGRVMIPMELQGIVQSPITTDEHMSGVVLERVEGRNYIAKATLERKLQFPGDISHTETLTMHTEDFSLGAPADAAAFLAFEGLLRDGTPVQERSGDERIGRETVQHYEWRQGQLASTGMPFGVYWSQTRDDIQRLTRDFSVENLKRLDSKLLIGVCAVAALAINGGMAWVAYRRKKAKGA